MASPDGGAAPASLDDPNRLYEDGGDSISGSSHIGSDASSTSLERGDCRWRNSRYHDMECSRYFDCPTHVVERQLSDDEAEDDDAGEDEPTVHLQMEDDPNEGSSSARLRTIEPAVPDVTSEPRASFTPVPERTTTDQPTEPASSAQAISARDTQGPDESQDPEEAAPAPPTPLSSRLSESSQPLPPTATPAQPTGEFVPPERSSSLATSQAASLSLHDLPLRPALSPSRPPTTPPPPPARRSSSSAAVPPVSRAQQSSEERSSPPEFIYPRWQPDAEVTLCPICHVQFSIFVRKHHCRKCGRVVCNACSPHRITIPYQYIVQPPGQPRLAAQRYPSSLISGEGGYADFSNLGGGERVRLCNPCVPDPNTTPPQQPLGSPSQLSPRGSHYRSQSSIGTMSSNAPPPNRFSGYFTSGPSPETYARSRSITHSGSGGPSGSRGHHQSTQNRIMAGTPPTYYPSSSSGYPGSSRYRSMLDVGSSSSSSAAQNRALPPPPPPQIAEEDECPVCHRELPSRSLPNFEAVRETHINTCITAHSTYSGTPTGETPQDTVGTPPPLAVRRTGMFPYVATEKDCVDSAECTICLEEFEVGVPMARLECLCRFHRSCISAWFVNHPGRCPVHQHDSFGY
ncbi:Fyve, RhoGef and Ph domain-containing protein [Colletotrichum tanaceti]|uniref:RING-type E3 ubiquitin transferase n=1 Tax=Colletotrichum tanaceti TaxID=1306861 RepID=A0A4U6XCM3_9PEZI|nr:Fyve, RhoGef and Ph domain-containing protein [Colletotrichum tanaceti]TKW53063.1 Fyve, RhoGef and Ph domain-containing protein [Colletotrichum tanaceti]